VAFSASDYFTQHFHIGQTEWSFDLEYKTLTLVPDGSENFYSGGITPAAEFPESLTGAQQVTLGDKDFVEIAQPVPFFGTTYDSFFISSNGYLTFDQGSTSYVSTLNPSTSDDYHFRRVRLAAYWVYLAPHEGGDVYWQRIATPGQERTVVTFVDVPNKYPSTSLVNFQIVLYDSGRITITWLDCAGYSAIVGLSREARTTLPPGFTETDLSELIGPSAPSFTSTPETTAEEGFLYSYSVEASDAQGDPIQITAPTLPAWLNLTPGPNGEATLSGTPSSSGSYPVQLEASDGTDSSTQNFTIEVLAPAPPTVTADPQSQTVDYGSSVQFSVSASSIRPITGYQWRKDGVDLSNGGTVSGATAATLNLDSVTDADEALYSVVVFNANGASAPSSGAALSVNPPPPPVYVAQPEDAWVSHGGTAQFMVEVSGYPPFSYQWQRNTGSGWQNLSDGGNLSGTTTGTLTLQNAQASDGVSYRVLTSNLAASDVASDPATLTVSAAGAPGAPTGLTTLQVYHNLVQLSWTDASGDETGFRVERADSLQGPWSLLAETAANVSEISDSSVTESTVYSYRVFAVNASGDSPPSAVLQVTTPADVPPQITWTFDEDLENWTHGEGGSRRSSALFFHDSSLLNMWHSSPRVNLLAGQTYTISFSARGRADKSLAFLATSEPGYPADISGRFSFQLTESYTTVSHDFSVPSDGVYYLTFFSNDIWPDAHIDNVTLSGNFNASPLVGWSYPTADLRTLTGSLIPLEAEASDSEGSVVRVDFIDENGDLIAPGASITSPPFRYEWNPGISGETIVTARAYDSSNAYADTEARTVLIEENRFSISSYLGDGASDDNITGMGYLSDGTLIVGGILNPDLFSGVSPVYVNGATTGDRGVVVRLSGDGRTVLGVTVVGAQVLDLDIGGDDRIHVAAGSAGLAVLESDGTPAFSAQYGTLRAHRVDAGEGGTVGVLCSSRTDYEDNRIHEVTVYLYDASFTLLSSMGGASHFTTDLAVDEATQTVGLIGWRNIYMDDGDGDIFPVDVPALAGRDFSGGLSYLGYDWGDETSGDRWLNRRDNNMADTRGARIVLGPDSRFYAAFEFDGGNTPLRYSPFDLDTSVVADIVGGDTYHSMPNTTTVPKTFVGRYHAATGAFEQGQWITARIESGSDNTTRIVNGNLLVDEAGRIHVTGSSASGMPIDLEPLPGFYSGGAWYLVYSPDFSRREFMTRLTRGNTAAIAVAPDGRYAVGGRSDSTLFDTNALQSTSSTPDDAWFAVGEIADYFAFQPGPHPRLFFDAAEQEALRQKVNREPYATMLAELIANRNHGDFFRPTTEDDPLDVLLRASANAKIYALTGDESYALDARTDVETALGLIDANNNWARSSLKGLDSYWYAVKLAITYDLCHSSEAWDSGFCFQISKRLVEIAPFILNDGGSEQNTDWSSNWQAARASSGGLALLATDHAYEDTLMDSAEQRLTNFFTHNQGAGTRGWNPEGVGYTAFAIGSYVGPFAVALDRLEPARSVSDRAGLQWMPWTAYAGSVPAPADDPFNVYGLGGIKTDWSDDNGHIGGEGLFGFAFYFAPESIHGGLRYAYDRLQGSLAPAGIWDAVRHGTFWSILYYPDDIPAQDPLEIWEWHQANVAPVGLGIMSWRDGFEGADDILVQFKARSRPVDTNSHDGPDGLGFRILGPGAPFAVGGGRNAPGRDRGQATVYPGDPGGTLSIDESHTGSFVGTPLAKIDGGGHAIASMTTSNVGTTQHKRWIITDFDRAATGADAVVVVADTTGNGAYWQMPTFLNNTVTVIGNTFTITGENGATLQGTVLHPGGSPTITTGIRERGSAYTLLNGGTIATESVSNPRVTDNRYLLIEDGGDGDFLVVMTINNTGVHPEVTQLSGTVADAVVQVGGRSYALRNDDVHYDGTAYAAPDVTVTFDPGAHGSLVAGSAVQTIAYGGAAVEPTVEADAAYTFAGWDKSFDPVTRDMTVTALYQPESDSLSAAEQWRLDYFGQSENTGDAEDMVDYDNDGVVNLLERAFGTHPGESGSVRQVSGQVTEQGDLRYPSIRYPRLAGGSGTTGIDYTVDDLMYTVEYGTDLSGSMNTGAVSQVGNAVDNGDGTETVTVRTHTPAETGTPAFLRLRVQRLP
jgi:hypothetical protein